MLVTSNRPISSGFQTADAPADGMSLPIRPKWDFGTSSWQLADKLHPFFVYTEGRNGHSLLQCESRVRSMAPGGGSRQRSMMSATEGEPDGRWMRPEPPLATPRRTRFFCGNPHRTNFWRENRCGLRRAPLNWTAAVRPRLPWSIPHRRWIEDAICILSQSNDTVTASLTIICLGSSVYEQFVVDDDSRNGRIG